MAAVTVTLLVSSLAACSGDGGAGIRVAEVGRGTVTEVVEAPATVTAKATATVSAAADGILARLAVRDGQQVRRGQLLLRIESPSARRALRQARQADAQAAAAGTVAVPVAGTGAAQADAAARQAFAQARRSARALTDPAARAQALAALRVSQSQYDAARAQADQSADQLAAGLAGLAAAVEALSAAQRVQTRAAVQAARHTVAALTVRAPISGTVSLSPPASPGGDSSSADLLAQLPESLRGQAGQALGGGSSGSSVSATVAQGAPVRAGQPLVAVTDASSLSLTASVDETDVLLVSPGVAASAELDAVPEATYPGTVTAVDPLPTPSSRGGVSYVVRVALGRGTTASGSAAPAPRPGMSAVVDLRVRTARNALVVPAAAVFRQGRRDAVYVVKYGVARERLVRLGAQGVAQVQVVEGLAEGESVVVRGVDRVSDGQRL